MTVSVVCEIAAALHLHDLLVLHRTGCLGNTAHQVTVLDCVQVYEVNKKLLQEHAAPLMAVYLHGVAVVRQELNMDVGRKSIKGMLMLVRSTPRVHGHCHAFSGEAAGQK